jgi:hypothetical protein
MYPHRQTPIARSRRSSGRCALWWFLTAVFWEAAAYGQLNTNDIPPLAPPYGELPPTFWEQYEMAILVGGGILLAGGLVCLRFRLRPAAPVVLAPEIAARQALSACSSRPEDGALLSEVSHVVKRYAAAAFALPADEVTTAEFCARLAANESVGADLASRLAQFFQECDDRKFAPRLASSPLHAITRASELIALGEARRTLTAQASDSRPSPAVR